MTRPIKHVGDDAMQRISIALDTIAADPHAPRTKREIERRAGLSHDAVARAFRQDAAEGSRWNLTARFSSLDAGLARRRGARDQEICDLNAKLAQKNQQIKDLQATVDRYAMAVLAQHLELQQLPEPSSNLVAMGRKHRPDDHTSY